MIPEASVTPQIYDAEGGLRDLTWLRANYGDLQFLSGGHGPKFVLSAIRETKGPSAIVVLVHRLQNGSRVPMLTQPVANYWLNMRLDPDNSSIKSLGPELKSRYQNVACVQYTDGVESSTGFGMGGGSYYTPTVSQRGPHTVWVLSPSYPSDGVLGLGMLPGTNHWGMLRVEFELREEASQPPEPEPEPEPEPAELLQLLRHIDQTLSALSKHLGVGE